MSDDRRMNRSEDTYDVLHQSFSMQNPSSASKTPAEPDVRNSGEVYFSANADESRERNYETKEFSRDYYGQNAASARRTSSAGGRRTASQEYGRQSGESARSASSAGYASRSSAASGARSSSSAYAGRASGSAASSSASGSSRSGAAQAGRSRSAASGSSARSQYGSRSSRPQESRGRRSAAESAGRNASATRRSASSSRSRSAKAKEAEAYTEPKSRKKTKSAAGGKKRGSGFTLAAIVIVVVVLVSFLLRIPIMGCINDIVAINSDGTEVQINVGENMTTNDVIDVLKENDLIYSARFCKLIYKLMGHDESEVYPAGVYTVSADMGLEGMLREIITAGATDATVTITFPEGFTLDQIIEKLATNGVASSSALYSVVDDPASIANFVSQYEFLAGIENSTQRYHALEGYMYPDTYDFYIGESPQSVIGRFLSNFQEKWNEEFADRLEKSEYTMDEILTIASILEKEAKDVNQMGDISGIIYNRLGNSSFPNLQCDSTLKYVDNNKSKLVQAGRYASLLKAYDTYQVTGLPAGPICNPGFDAILSALSPENNDYYYFVHDATGEVYYAATQQEHEANKLAAGVS